MARLILGGLTPPVLLDGAWATQLQSQGLDARACPDAWNLSHPEQVMSVAQSYVRAGSQIILTNTFGANRIALSFFGMTANLAEINRAGVRLSRAAADGKARVFASIGPSRKSLERGEVSEGALAEAFTEQATHLAEAGADALVLETFTQINELQLAMACAKATGLPVVASLAGADWRRPAEPDAVDLRTTVQLLVEAGADAIGFNCASVSEDLVSRCAQLRTLTDRPLWFKPNAGLPTLDSGKLRYPHSSETFAEVVRTLIDAGADLIGGCCGTSPSTIEAIAVSLRGAKV